MAEKPGNRQPQKPRKEPPMPLKDLNLFWAGTVVIAALFLILIGLLIWGRVLTAKAGKIPTSENEAGLFILLAISGFFYFVFLIMLRFMQGYRHPRISETKAKPKLEFNGGLAFGTLCTGAIVLGALIFLATRPEINRFQEGQTSILIVLGVSTLTFLLFILTLGFRSLGLADVAQALGLPPGSVRAFIALMLIMIFVILSVYAVRIVGEGNYFYLGQVTRDVLAANFSDTEKYVSQVVRPPPGAGQPAGVLYDVWQVRELTPDGKNLAQQITTTIATLVVAVAGFYFGTNSVDAARRAVASSTEAVLDIPLIRNIDPDEGEIDQTIDANLKGKNLSSIKSVKLVKSQETLEADDILTNDTTIRCTFVLSGSAGIWKLIVENAEGEKDELEDAFTIKEPPPSESDEVQLPDAPLPPAIEPDQPLDNNPL